MSKIRRTLRNLKCPNVEKYQLGPVIDFTKNFNDNINIPNTVNVIKMNVNDYLSEMIPDSVKNAINDKFPGLTDPDNSCNCCNCCKCCKCCCNFSFLNVLPKLTYKIDIDLRSQCPRIYDQGNMGSCSANAGCLFYSMISHQPDFEGSRMFLYYNSREREGHVSDDKGAVVFTAVACLRDFGLCSESNWDYSKDRLYTKPGENLYQLAEMHKLKTVKYLERDRVSLLNCLESGKPFLFGFNLGKDFRKRVGRTGTYFKESDTSFLGSHCVCCVGYSQEAHAFLVANSWGDKWGFKGYFLMSETLMLDPKVTGMFFTAEI
jgi:hypothetical protein